jgi:proline racemase
MQILAGDDSLRRLLLREPRGSVACHANLVVPATRPDCDAGFIIMEPTEYPAMSGSNTICTVTVLLETGMIPMQEPETVVRLEAPGGVVEARAACSDGRCESVELTNVPSFVDRLDAKLEVEGLGALTVDVAYGGMWYAIADASAFGFTLEPHEARELSLAGERIRAAAREQLTCVHPENPEIAGVSIVQLAEPWRGVGQVTRNAVVVAPGRLDRSATGTGLSARMAVLHSRAEMQVGDSIFMLSDEQPGMGCRAPVSVGGTPVSQFMYVPDVDSAFKRAVDAGAKVVMPVSNMFWGDRFGQVDDPSGHRWGLATHVEDVSPEEMNRRQKEFFASMAQQGASGQQK